MLTLEEILEKSKNCLNCKKPNCMNGCPMKTKIPEFINEIKNNNFKQAYYILQENNIMSEVCSNVCPHEKYCMGNCVRGIKGKPVEISLLEKNINIWAKENNVEYQYERAKANGIKVAIIGGGPAGIACSKELAINGFEVTIFEKENKIGGLLTYGIPGFRLPKDITENLTEKLNKLGVKIKNNVEFGKDITIESLKLDGYKAIFIGIGAEICSTYKLSDDNCENVYKSNYVLKKYNKKEIIDNLGDTIVIGRRKCCYGFSPCCKKNGSNEVYGII